MHSVPPKPGPAYLLRYKVKYKDQVTGEYCWTLSTGDHANLIRDLAHQFGAPIIPFPVQTSFGRKPDPDEGICAYCERACSKIAGPPNHNRIDHFYPRSGCNRLSFEWANLMYVCKRCNDVKNDCRVADELKLDREAYVNPRKGSAGSFFTFNIDDTGCRIIPNPNLNDQVDIDKAKRTIDDFGLDAIDTIINRNLRVLRNNHVMQIKAVVDRMGPSKFNSLLHKMQNPRSEYSSAITWAVESGYFR